MTFVVRPFLSLTVLTGKGYTNLELYYREIYYRTNFTGEKTTTMSFGYYKYIALDVISMLILFLLRCASPYPPPFFEQVRKRLIRRGTKKLPPGSFKWWEDMESTAKSGWLSREQLAASEFARRVAVKHGIGVVASNMKRKEDQVQRTRKLVLMPDVLTSIIEIPCGVS